MMTLWAVAGSSALAGATLAYVMGRTRLVPIAGRARDGFKRATSWWRKDEERPRAAVAMYQRATTSSGNAAFDEYRQETLHKLVEEEREFRDYLERLRMARDRSEFDQFMTERKSSLSA
jgi:hypothetical protein